MPFVLDMYEGNDFLNTQLYIHDVVDHTGQAIADGLPLSHSSADVAIDTNIAPFLADEPVIVCCYDHELCFTDFG